MSGGAAHDGVIKIEPLDILPGTPEDAFEVHFRLDDRHNRFGIDRFGASAPAGDLFEKFGFTADAIVPQIMNKLNG